MGPRDNSGWQEGLDEGTPGFQEEGSVDWDLSFVFSSEVSKYDGNIVTEGSAPRLDAGVEM